MIPRSGYWNRQFRRREGGAGANQFQDDSVFTDCRALFSAAIPNRHDIVFPAPRPLAQAAITFILVPRKACQVKWQTRNLATHEFGNPQ